jgi:hypothetical protein
VNKLTTAIERQVNPRGRAAVVGPWSPVSPVSSHRCDPESSFTTEATRHRQRQRRSRSRVATDLESELKEADEPPPPYPGHHAVAPPPSYA